MYKVKKSKSMKILKRHNRRYINFFKNVFQHSKYALNCELNIVSFSVCSLNLIKALNKGEKMWVANDRNQLRELFVEMFVFVK